MAVIAMLISLLLPAVLTAREAARQASCTDNLRQLGTAAIKYHDAQKELPAESLFDGTPCKDEKDIVLDELTSENHASYRARLLPYIGQEAIRAMLDKKPKNIEDVAKTAVPVFFCPDNAQRLVDVKCSDGAERYASHYYGVAGALGRNPSGEFYSIDETRHQKAVSGRSFLGPFANTGTIIVGGKVTLDSITDGLANTFLLGEISWSDYGSHYNWIRGTCITNPTGKPAFVTNETTGKREPSGRTALASSKGIAEGFAINEGKKKGEPLSLKLDKTGEEYKVPTWGRAAGHGVGGFGSNHHGGANFVHADGAVQFFSETTDTKIMMYRATRSGGEHVSP
jgi:hypothetical protein